MPRTSPAGRFLRSSRRTRLVPITSHRAPPLKSTQAPASPSRTMPSRARLATSDPDLGLTLLLLLADLLQEYWSHSDSPVVITDEALVGRPFRRGPHRNGEDFRAWRDDHLVVHLACTSSSIVLRRRPLVEALRKARGIAARLAASGASGERRKPGEAPRFPRTSRRAPTSIVRFVGSFLFSECGIIGTSLQWVIVATYTYRARDKGIPPSFCLFTC